MKVERWTGKGFTSFVVPASELEVSKALYDFFLERNFSLSYFGTGMGAQVSAWGNAKKIEAAFAAFLKLHPETKYTRGPGT